MKKENFRRYFQFFLIVLADKSSALIGASVLLGLVSIMPVTSSPVMFYAVIVLLGLAGVVIAVIYKRMNKPAEAKFKAETIQEA